MKAEEVKQVVEWLDQYGKGRGAGPLRAADFGAWLRSQAEGKEEPTLPPNADGLISMYLGFMANYAAFYARRVFRQLDLYSMTDWAFLATLQRAGQLTKSDLIQQNILEKSTGTEVLKRLAKQGYIRELPNPEDRRAKFVQLTTEGKRVVEEANQRILPMGQVVTGDLTEGEKGQLLALLQKLHYFHKPIFAAKDESAILELLEGQAQSHGQ